MATIFGYKLALTDRFVLFLTMPFSCFCSVQISEFSCIDKAIGPLVHQHFCVSECVCFTTRLPTCVAVLVAVTMHLKCVQFQFVHASVSCCLCTSVCDFSCADETLREIGCGDQGYHKSQCQCTFLLIPSDSDSLSYFFFAIMLISSLSDVVCAQVVQNVRTLMVYHTLSGLLPLLGGTTGKEGTEGAKLLGYVCVSAILHGHRCTREANWSVMYEWYQAFSPWLQGKIWEWDKAGAMVPP